MNDSKPEIVRLSSAATLVASVPHFLGYTPAPGSTALIQLVGTDRQRIGMMAVLAPEMHTPDLDLTRHFLNHRVLAVHYGPATPVLVELLHQCTGAALVDLFQVVGPMVGDPDGLWTEIADAPEPIKDGPVFSSREEKAKLCAGDPAAPIPSPDPLIQRLGSNKPSRDRWLGSVADDVEGGLAEVLAALRTCNPADDTADQARESAMTLAAATGDGGLLNMIDDTVVSLDRGGLGQLVMEMARAGMNLPEAVQGMLQELRVELPPE